METRELYVLIGANIRMAHDWCEERGIRRTEVGRTVFATSMDPDILRGRRGPITRVYAPDDGRPWTDRDMSRSERYRLVTWDEEIDFVNRVAS